MQDKVRFSFYYFFLVLAGIMFLQWLFFPRMGSIKEISYKSFKDYLDSGKEARVVILPDKIVGELKNTDTNTASNHNMEIGPSTSWRLRFQEM